MTTKNVLIVELNEFNYDLITSTLKQVDLPAIAKVFNFPQASYKTQDRYNSGFLEPWVQWVSVHTGVPSVVHGIKHLGDVPHLNVEQCWETLSRHGITTGVWGAMNGEKRRAENALFFLPDPWTFSEWGTPSDLNNLLRLPRYLAKNYQNLKYSRIAVEAVKLLNFILRSGVAIKIFKEAFNLLKPLKQFGFKHFIFISCFDYVSTLLFIQYKKKYQPRCSYLFLNSLAHIQHHHWREGTDVATPEIIAGLKNIDRLLTQLFKAFPDDAIVVHNALSQMNTNHEKPWVLYRQKDPATFLKALNIPALKVEQHMTHDGHVFFSNEQQRDFAYESLHNAIIEDKPLFHVEKNASDPCKLFYMLKFTDELSPQSAVTFRFNNKNYNFFEHFDRIVTRTGRHIPMGKVFSDTIPFPDHMQNHEFNKHIFHYLLPERYTLVSKQEKTSELELEYELV
jgi:hypothetical protein